MELAWDFLQWQAFELMMLKILTELLDSSFASQPVG
jgi:hypothetical protein